MGGYRWIKSFPFSSYIIYGSVKKNIQIVADPTLLYDEIILIQILQTNILNPWDSTLYVRKKADISESL